jgi:hypothetical protein
VDVWVGTEVWPHPKLRHKKKFIKNIHSLSIFTLYRFSEYHPISFQVKQEALLKRIFHKKQLDFVENRRGQSTVEYVLMLVIVLSLILGSRVFFTSINDFMSDYMGEYIVCLMEYGELPSLGVADADLKKHEGGAGGPKCDFRRPTGQAAFGGGFGGGSGGSGGGGGSGNGGGSNGGSRNGGRSGGRGGQGSVDGSSGNGSSGSSGGSDSAGGGRGGGSSRSRALASRSPYDNGMISRMGDSSTADAPQSSADGKVKVLESRDGKDGGDGGFDGDGAHRRSRQRYLNANGRYKGISGEEEAEIEKKSSHSTMKGGSRVIATSDEGYRFLPIKRTFVPPEPNKVVEEKQEEGFSFGNFLKWLIIAGIVIAAFILFGGQALNFSNSD